MFSWLWGKKNDDVKEVGELQAVKDSLKVEVEALQEEKKKLEEEVARLNAEISGMRQ